MTPLDSVPQPLSIVGARDQEHPALPESWNPPPSTAVEMAHRMQRSDVMGG